MDQKQMSVLLENVAKGTVSPAEALLQLKMQPFKELDEAFIDTHSAIREGIPEVLYGANKTKEQIRKIVQAEREEGQPLVLVTKMDAETAEYLRQYEELNYDETAQIGWVGQLPEPDGNGTIVIVTAGTSDIPVAREAAITAQAFGNQVKCIYDLGVSGMHKILSHMEDLMSAQVVVTVAGMEGALACIIAGMVSCPVIAVPTSIGYGVSEGGIAALLSMLSSCSSGVSVVNIDNGYGAGYIASSINHLPGKGMD